MLQKTIFTLLHFFEKQSGGEGKGVCEIFYLLIHSPVATVARAEPGRSQKAENSSESPKRIAVASGLILPLLPQVYQQGFKSEVDQPGLEPVSIGNADIKGANINHNDTTLASTKMVQFCILSNILLHVTSVLCVLILNFARKPSQEHLRYRTRYSKRLGPGTITQQLNSSPCKHWDSI